MPRPGEAFGACSNDPLSLAVFNSIFQKKEDRVVCLQLDLETRPLKYSEFHQTMVNSSALVRIIAPPNVRDRR